tara:strand:+ start:1995 stop:2297 length:303 start_codon:yes stop_codon:yes gene_type:complete
MEIRTRADNERYLVRDMDMGGFTASITELHPSQSTLGHSHPWTEAYLLIEGIGTLHVGVKDPYVMSRGTIYKISAGVDHRVSTDAGVSFACFFVGDRGSK